MASAWLRRGPWEPAWVVAHRGASARAPENTVAAFEAALEDGADALELDVALTADGVAVVLHDPDLARTTNGEGALVERPWREVARLDAGSWFGPAFAGERVPALEEVLDRFGRRALLDLELKAPPGRPLEAPVEVVHRLVVRAGLTRRVLLSSFVPAVLARCARLRPRLALGLLTQGAPEAARAPAACRRLGALAWLPEARAPGLSAVLRAAGAGLATIPWTVNDEPGARAWLRAGAAGLVTDAPRRLAGLRAGRRARPPAPRLP